MYFYPLARLFGIGKTIYYVNQQWVSMRRYEKIYHTKVYLYLIVFQSKTLKVLVWGTKYYNKVFFPPKLIAVITGFVAQLI